MATKRCVQWQSVTKLNRSIILFCVFFLFKKKEKERRYNEEDCDRYAYRKHNRKYGEIAIEKLKSSDKMLCILWHKSFAWEAISTNNISNDHCMNRFFPTNVPSKPYNMENT